MTYAAKRRDLLNFGAVLGTGLAMGAFTTKSLAQLPKTMDKGDFVGGFDERLDEDQLRRLISGHTIDGVTYKGQEYSAYFDPNGMVDKAVGNRREQGQWQIKDDTLQMQFPTLAGGDRFDLQVYAHQNGGLYKGWSEGERRWTWFVPVGAS